MDNGGPVVACWACHVLIQVPCIDQRPADSFKCGWCGGINKLDQEQICQPHVQHAAPYQQWQLYPQSQPPLQPSSLPGSIAKQDPMQHTWQAGAEYHQGYQHHWQLQQQQNSMDQQMQHMQHEHQNLQQAGQQTQLHHAQHLTQDMQLHAPSQVLPGQQPHNAQFAAHQQLQLNFSPMNIKPRGKHRDCALACRHTVQLCWGWFIVSMVMMIISSVAGTGVLMLLPRLCTTWSTYVPNLAFAVVLLTNVVFNYAASVLQSPGRIADWVAPPAKGAAGEVLQGSYKLYSFCGPCRAAKPPVAHHCRTCGVCVVDMDHHCPFINNCVGRGNLRPFLLFLFWTLLAAVYMLAMCSMLVHRNWDAVRDSIGSSMLSRYGTHNNAADSDRAFRQDVDSNSSMLSSSGSVEHSVPAAHPADWITDNWMIAVTGYGALVLQTAPGWLLATYYLVAASLALLLALGILLWSQLQYLSKGVTYIQHLKGQGGGYNTEQYVHQQRLAGGLGGVQFNQLNQQAATAVRTAGVKTRFQVLRVQLRRVLGLNTDDGWWRVLKVLVVPKLSTPAGTGFPVDKKWT